MKNSTTCKGDKSLYYIRVSALKAGKPSVVKLRVKGKELTLAKIVKTEGRMPKDFVTDAHLLDDL